MGNIRVIPKLDIKGPNLVKGIHLEGLRVLGKPENFAKFYFESGADELIYMDVVASLYGRNSLADIIEKTSRQIFIPLTVGGGLRSLHDIQAVLRAGADKVTLNTAAIGNPELITEASRRFGSSTIVVSIEAFKHADGHYEAYTDNGREATGIEAFEWAQKVEQLGAGEIMVTSINQEGTGKGYDLDLVQTIAKSVGIPVIACGGAGNMDDVVDVVQKGNADAVSAASLFHYYFVKYYDANDEFVVEGNTEYLKRTKENNNVGFSKIKDVSLAELKQHLNDRHIACRPFERQEYHGSN